MTENKKEIERAVIGTPDEDVKIYMLTIHLCALSLSSFLSPPLSRACECLSERVFRGETAPRVAALTIIPDEDTFGSSISGAMLSFKVMINTESAVCWFTV